jgi:curved DNA-binding protein CbpA
VATHYDTLGVSSDASASEVRAAYIARARALHPDRHAGRDASDVARSERAMQEVNIAWSVLGDPAARQAYDATLRPVETPAAPPRQTPWPVVVLDEPRDFGPALPRLVRIGPIVLILAVLGAIFVFTAFAAGSRSVDVPGRSSGSSTDAIVEGSCVQIGSTLTPVRCSDPHDARVVAVVAGTTDCAYREVPYTLGIGRVACLAPA